MTINPDGRQSDGVTPSGSGYSAEPEPSFTVSAVPVSIPNAEREDCDICGAKPIRVIVEGRALCEVHRDEWLGEEIAYADEAQIRRVMAALDAVLDEPVDEWNNHLRKLAMVAVGAM